MIDEIEDLRAFKALALELINRKGYSSLDEFIDKSSRNVKTYTKGIRKIYEANKLIDIYELATNARDNGYDLLCHNGVIYYIDDRKNDNGKFIIMEPIPTSLMIDDFERHSI
jgi:hypothetical protein